MTLLPHAVTEELTGQPSHLERHDNHLLRPG